ncbi:MAG: hypothetical protein P4L36_11555 [Holophaga sp.]|nr:hypothetical protein [Holophaga sp.]
MTHDESREDEDDSIYTKRPIPLAVQDFDPDMIGLFLKRNGFPLNEAEWTRAQLSGESDEADVVTERSYYLDKPWSWPHFAFRSRQEWQEYTQWWRFPESETARQGKARDEQHRQEVSRIISEASTPAVAQGLTELAELAREMDNEPLPSWIKTGPVGNAS